MFWRQSAQRLPMHQVWQSHYCKLETNTGINRCEIVWWFWQIIPSFTVTSKGFLKTDFFNVNLRDCPLQFQTKQQQEHFIVNIPSPNSWESINIIGSRDVHWQEERIIIYIMFLMKEVVKVCKSVVSFNLSNLLIVT